MPKAEVKDRAKSQKQHQMIEDKDHILQIDRRKDRYQEVDGEKAFQNRRPGQFMVQIRGLAQLISDGFDVKLRCADEWRFLAALAFYDSEGVMQGQAHG